MERKEKRICKEVYKNINNLSEQLKSNEEERKRLDNIREDWISNISHDIKTPLVSIKGYAEILADGKYGFGAGEIKEYSKIIESKSNYIKELIDDLNLSTRLKNKTLNLNLEITNIVSLIREVIIDILNNPKTKDVNIDFVASSELIENNIDEVLIKRVITNLYTML